MNRLAERTCVSHREPGTHNVDRDPTNRDRPSRIRAVQMFHRALARRPLIADRGARHHRHRPNGTRRQLVAVNLTRPHPRSVGTPARWNGPAPHTPQREANVGTPARRDGPAPHTPQRAPSVGTPARRDGPAPHTPQRAPSAGTPARRDGPAPHTPQRVSNVGTPARRDGPAPHTPQRAPNVGTPIHASVAKSAGRMLGLASPDRCTRPAEQLQEMRKPPPTSRRALPGPRGRHRDRGMWPGLPA
jgi:hypothetical protein